MIEIRRKSPKDLKDISRILTIATQILRKTYYPKNISDSSSKNSTEVLESLVAIAEEKIVGVVEYKEFDDYIYFQGLAVDPVFQKRGIARNIVNALGNIARKSDCKKLCMATIEETGNVLIFEKIGFNVVSKKLTDRYQSNNYPE